MRQILYGTVVSLSRYTQADIIMCCCVTPSWKNTDIQYVLTGTEVHIRLQTRSAEVLTITRLARGFYFIYLQVFTIYNFPQVPIYKVLLLN